MRATAGWLAGPDVKRRTCDYCLLRLPESELSEIVRGDETEGWVCRECAGDGHWVQEELEDRVP